MGSCIHEAHARQLPEAYVYTKPRTDGLLQGSQIGRWPRNWLPSPGLLSWCWRSRQSELPAKQLAGCIKAEQVGALTEAMHPSPASEHTSFGNHICNSFCSHSSCIFLRSAAFEVTVVPHNAPIGRLPLNGRTASTSSSTNSLQATT